MRANLDALATLRRCEDDDRWADPGEQAVLARWSGWGAIPDIFDDNDDRLAVERAELRGLLGTEAAWAQARRTTLNAHYTSATVVQAMSGAAAALGASGLLRVLEPGCGSGNLLGVAPADARLTGVELDETTAAIAQHLYGAKADIQVGPFEDLRVEDGAYDFVIGNVPFANRACSSKRVRGDTEGS